MLPFKCSHGTRLEPDAVTKCRPVVVIVHEDVDKGVGGHSETRGAIRDRRPTVGQWSFENLLGIKDPEFKP
jgi:hypothetical protein